MNIVREVEKVIAIQDQQKKLDVIIGPLEQLFERGRALQLPPTRLGQATSLFLLTALEEQQAELQEEMLATALTAVSWNKIGKYVDWISLVEHLPQLSGYSQGYALAMLGWSQCYAFLPVLQDYLSDPNLVIQVEALKAMQRIWWQTSDHAPEVQKMIQMDRLAQLEETLSWSTHYAPFNQALRQHFAAICAEIIPSMKEWFQRHKGYTF